MRTKEDRIPFIDLDLSQLDCLTSPKRSDILSAMRHHESVSVKSVAAELGQSPEAVHYHMKALLKAGLVRIVGEQEAGRRYERLYDRVAESYRIDSESGDVEYRRLVRKTASRLVQMSGAEYEACSRRGDADPQLRDRAFARRFSLRLTPGAMAELRIRMAEVMEWARRQESDKGHRVAGLVMFSQLEEGGPSL